MKGTGPDAALHLVVHFIVGVKAPSQRLSRAGLFTRK